MVVHYVRERIDTRQRLFWGGIFVADHDVRFSASRVRVAGIDFEFDVAIDGKTLGTLYVSEGNLQWRPKHGQKRSVIPISWKEFAEWAES
ncbi:hypothetical protein A9310_11615 [Gordonia sp. UCD-TK1]|nr:hypothetical protein A9310_11615 [Gordonia sp. UCD-TK1]